MKLMDRLVFGEVDPRGVPRLRTRPTLVSAVISFVLAAYLLLPLAEIAQTHFWYGWGYLTFQVVGLLTSFAIFLFLGVWSLKLWMKVRRLKSASQLAEEFGISVHDLNNVARARGVLPQYLLSGDALYTQEGLTGVEYLLRPAVVTGNLLTPAPSTVPESETLLRVHDAD